MNLAVKKMIKIEEEHRCIFVQLKEAKCEVEGLKGELVKAYSKIKFLELEIIQANVKVKHIQEGSSIPCKELLKISEDELWEAFQQRKVFILQG